MNPTSPADATFNRSPESACSATAQKDHATGGSLSTVKLAELFSALHILRKARAENINLASTSTENIELLSKSQSQRSKTRFLLYVLWALAIAYFFALLNRETICESIGR